MPSLLNNDLTHTFTSETNYYIRLFCLHCSDKLLIEDRSIDFFYEFCFTYDSMQEVVNEVLSSDTALSHHGLGT